MFWKQREKKREERGGGERLGCAGWAGVFFGILEDLIPLIWLFFSEDGSAAFPC